MKVIKSKEPVEIIIKSGGYGDDECYVSIDGQHYATIHGVTEDQVDEEKVRIWVEETYSSMDYQSSHYVVPRLKGADFI